MKRAISNAVQIGLGGMVFSIVLLIAARPGVAHYPSSPFVQDMVAPAVRYLESAGSPELGGECLIALALYKADQPKTHPRIQRAVKSVQDAIRTKQIGGFRAMYSPAIACIFLCEIDAEKYQQEIQTILNLILDRQGPHGAWSYVDFQQKGDTSQTQYCCLALWEARKHGFNVPPNAGLKVLNWLMATQDTRGGFAYQPDVPAGNERYNQGDTTLSISAAGLGSVYITADWLGYGRSYQQVRLPEEEGLPPAVSLVVERKVEELGRKLIAINEERLQRSESEGNRWFQNNFKVESEQWPYYYLYGFERYASFREMAEGRNEAEPEWYNQGAEFLKTEQSNDGSWPTESGESTSGVSTAFCLLFLLRSTKQTLNADFSYQEGVLKGGSALPDDGQLTMKNGRVAAMSVTKNVNDLLAMLESPDDDDLDAFAESLKSLKFGDDASRTQQSTVLRSLINHKKHQARLIAVRHIGAMRNIDYVPLLIFALSDPNGAVVREANIALRSISRSFDDFKLSDEPDKAEIELMQEKWSQWFKSVKPDGQLY